MMGEFYDKHRIIKPLLQDFSCLFARLQEFSTICTLVSVSLLFVVAFLQGVLLPLEDIDFHKQY